jgi:uncharacterized protein (DUF433 family)
VATVELLSRPVYLYSDVDRLLGLTNGTARRWVNGYHRKGQAYLPVLRVASTDTEWATWGEFVETRMLAEYRAQDIPMTRLREAVQGLRAMFSVDNPLVWVRPYLAADAGELSIERRRLDPDDDEGRMVIRTQQLLLSEPSRAVLDTAVLARGDGSDKFIAEMPLDRRFEGIVVNPERQGGRPTFKGRRVAVAAIAGMAAAGEPVDDLAADYGLSRADVQAAIDYVAEHPAA